MAKSSGSLRPLTKAELERRLGNVQTMKNRASNAGEALPSVSVNLSKRISPMQTPKKAPTKFRLKENAITGWSDSAPPSNSGSLSGASSSSSIFAPTSALVHASPARYAHLNDREVPFIPDPLKSNSHLNTNPPPSLPPSLPSSSPNSDRSGSNGPAGYGQEPPNLPSNPPSLPGSGPPSLPPSLPPSAPVSARM